MYLPIKEMCSQLWCSVPSEEDTCRSLNQPPADGTACGKKMVSFVKENLN